MVKVCRQPYWLYDSEVYWHEPRSPAFIRQERKSIKSLGQRSLHWCWFRWEERHLTSIMGLDLQLRRHSWSRYRVTLQVRRCSALRPFECSRHRQQAWHIREDETMEDMGKEDLWPTVYHLWPQSPGHQEEGARPRCWLSMLVRA